MAACGTTGSLPPSAAGPAAIALARCFVVAPLYPAQHEGSRAAAGQCLEALRAAAAGPEPARIDVGRLGLRIQGEAVPQEHPQVQRLHKQLADLGIARLEIDADATPQDVHRFVTLLVEARRRFGGAHGLRQLEIEGLPGTVRIVQHEFGRRTGDAGSAASVEAAVARALDGHDGMDPETRALLRGAMERVFGDVVESLSDGRLARTPGQPFGRSLDEVLELGANALRTALEDLTAAGGDSADIQGLFDAAEKALAVANDRASVEVLMSVLRQSSRELRPGPEPGKADAGIYELSIEAMRDGFESYGEGPDFPRPPSVDRREELSILLHVLLAAPPDGVRQAATECLEAVLARPLGETERAFLEGALRGLASRESPAALDAVLSATLRALRPAGGAVRVLVSLSSPASPGQQEALWPHLVNEILLHDGDAAERRALLTRLSSAGGGPRADRLERLLSLEAVREQRFSPALFDPPPLPLYEVFGALLARQAGGFADALLAGFQRRLPPWPGSEALLTFREVTLACRAFLIAVLRESDAGRASPATEQQARRTLADALRGLPRADVRSAWVPRAIEALGAIGTAAERPLLQEIKRGFRIWPWRRWPSACREAARAAQAAPGSAAREG